MPGIQFTESSTSPTNTPGANAGFMWVQILTDKFQYLEPLQIETCVSAGSPSNSLDNLYPYPPSSATATMDSPASPELGNKNESENARSFHATMYLMWNPALPSGCTLPSTTPTGSPGSYQTSPGQGCTSIPIPLGSIVWSTCADAINTLNPNVSASNWMLGCGVPQTYNNGPTFNTDSGFPTWQTTSLTAIIVNGHNQVPNDICTAQPH